MSGHANMPPASHQVSATSLKLLIQQIHPHVRVEREGRLIRKINQVPRGILFYITNIPVSGRNSARIAPTALKSKNTLICSYGHF